MDQEIVARLSNDTNLTQRRQIEDAWSFISGLELSPEAAGYAMERSADAIKHGLRIFISHKTEDEELAKKLRKLLIDYGKPVLARTDNGYDVFIAEQHLRGGQEWSAEIESKLQSAHWFILLLPDSEDNRDWTIYEAGYFKRGMASTEKLLCIHHPLSGPPAQLANLQAYESTPEGLHKMLKQLFFEDNAIPGVKSIGIDIEEQEVVAAAQELSKSFQAPKMKTCAQPWLSHIELNHEEGRTYEQLEDLLSLEVASVFNVWDVFRRGDGFEGSFQELIGDIHDEFHSSAWLDSLKNQLRDALVDRVGSVRSVPFQGASDGMIYRAFLHCLHRLGDAGPIIRFHIVFVEDVGGPVANAPADLDILETTLRWCYRSWWEVLEKPRINTPDSVDFIRHCTESSEQELLARGASEDPTSLLDCFDDPEVRQQLQQYQEEYRQKYRNGCDGLIDRAFRERNPSLLRDCIKELRPRTLWFMKQAAKTYAEKIAKLQ